MIRKIEINDIPGRQTNYNNMIQQEMRDFLRSDWPAAEIDTAKYKSAYTAAKSYGQAARKANLPVIAMARNGRAFLIRNPVEE